MKKPHHLVKKCAHLDTQLSDMEKRFEASLSASLSALTAGLKGLIDTSLKEALETMSNKVNKVIEEHPIIIQHGEQIDSLETENLILKNKVTRMEGETSHIKKWLATMESRALANNIIIKGAYPKMSGRKNRLPAIRCIWNWCH